MADLGVYVFDKNDPINGLTDDPEITIRRLDTGAVVAGPSAMTDVGADGLYRFTFAETAGIEYGFQVDADPLDTGQVDNATRFYVGGFFNDEQRVRDAMKLAPSVGAPAADSIDDKLDDLETQITALNDISVADILTAALLSGDTVDQALSRLDNIDVDVGTNIPAQIAALNDLSIADVQTALTNQGYTVARAPNLDNLDATISSRATVAAILAAVLTSGDSVDIALSRLDNIDADVATNIPALIAALNDLSIADVQTALTNQGYTAARAPNLDNLDATVSSRNSVTPLAAATDQAEHDATQAAIAALNNLAQSDILSDATPFAGANIDAAISTRATQSSVDTIDANVDTLLAALISAQTTAIAGGSTTEIRTNLTEADGFYDDAIVVVVNAAGVAARRVQGYLQLNGAFTVLALPFTPAATDPVFVLNDASSATAVLTQQQIRDAMKLAPTAGAPAAESVDEKLDNIETDTETMQPLVSANLDATVSSRATPADITASETTILAAITALNDLSIADVQTALTNQGYTAARAPNLDNLDATVSSRATVAGILSAVLGSGESVDVALSRLDNIDNDVATTIPALIAALNDISIADVQTALTSQGYTAARALLLDNLDATISSVALAVAALNDISVADILSATLGSGNTVDQELSAILLMRDFIEGGRDIDFTGNDALGWQRIERDTAGTLIRRYNLFDENGARINETVSSFINRMGMISSEVAI